MATTTTEDQGIAASALFAGCSRRELRRLEELTTTVAVRAGTELTREGALGQEFGVLLDGTATVRVDGRELARLEPGGHFGEIALLRTVRSVSFRRTATVTADVDLRAVVMSVREFATALDELPTVRSALVCAAIRRTTAGC